MSLNIRFFCIQQKKNAIIQHAVDDIILHENKKLSTEDEACENIYSEINEDDLYEIDDMSFDKNKENKE